MRALSMLMGLGVLLAAAQAHAFGEPISDVRVLDNSRTLEDTVRSIAGVSLGDILEVTTIETVKERLNNAGLFSDVNVWWEPRGRSGVRLNIAVKDKFPWAPVPTFSTSPGNWAAGVALVHANLFGQGKQLLLYARLASIDSGLTLGYRDPAFLGSWLYWEVRALVQRQVIPEYRNDNDDNRSANPPLYSQTAFWSYGAEATLGVAWFRRVKTQLSYRLESFDVQWTHAGAGYAPNAVPAVPAGTGVAAEAIGHSVGVLKPGLILDWRAREHALTIGPMLAFGAEYASKRFGGDLPRDYWKASMSWEHGLRVLHRHNFIYRVSAITGENLPIWAENYLGGTGLRGYLTQQFRGDTQVSTKLEYHFPLFSIGPLDFRGLAFFDSGVLWYRSLPQRLAPDPTVPGDPGQYPVTPNGRLHPAYLQRGLDLGRDFHNAAGGGLRFFLRSIALPLIGLDFGYGLDTQAWQWFLTVGA